MYLYYSLFKLAFLMQIEYEPQHAPTHHISHGPFINPRLMLLWMSLSLLLTRGQKGRQPDQFHQSIIHLLKLQFKKRRVKFEKLRKPLMEGKLLQMLFLGSMYRYKATCVCSLKLCLRAYIRCDMYLYYSLFKLAFLMQIEYEPQHAPTHHISHGPFINPRLMLLWLSLSLLLTRGQRGRQPNQLHQSIHVLKLARLVRKHM